MPLLQLGFISQYLRQGVIHMEQVPSRNLGIILWGEAILRRKHHEAQFHLVPGFAIGEEPLFEPTNRQNPTAQSDFACHRYVRTDCDASCKTATRHAASESLI